MIHPSPVATNGRDSTGKFVKGNACGKGNPYGRQVNEIRRTLLAAVSDDDLVQIARTLVERAKGGDVAAAKEILDRLIGRPKQSMAIEASISEERPVVLDKARWESTIAAAHPKELTNTIKQSELIHHDQE